MVEFTLVFPLLMFMVAATIEMGWAFNAYITVTNSARDVSRSGLSLTNSQICNLVLAQTARLSGTKQVVITRTKDTSGTNNESVDTLNNACACIDGVVSGTLSGHLVRNGTVERALQVQVKYSHNVMLSLDIAPFNDVMVMNSNAKFPVAPYYTAWNTTSTC
ncbi:MAG: pilus assembly protein [Dehalococcoidia bacterium]|nr:pilus assembly protein [Dehalococcoidia bacterium]